MDWGVLAGTITTGIVGVAGVAGTLWATRMSGDREERTAHDKPLEHPNP